jgi:hypothetical protein
MSDKLDTHDCAEAMCDPCRERYAAVWSEHVAKVEAERDAALEQAVKVGANLVGANLVGA